MKIISFSVGAALGSLLLTVNPASAQGTAFTYQGRLNDSGNPANGFYDLTFALNTTSNTASQAGNTLTDLSVGVTNGLFTVMLDFGNSVSFLGATYYLQIGARTNGAASFIPLSPRQQLTPTPYAIYAEGVSAAGINGTIPNADVSGGYANAVTFNNAANSFSGNGAGLTGVNASSLGGASAANFWQLPGNTVAAGQFLGSVNNQPLELRANNSRVMRLEPTTNFSPNVIGGASLNYVTPGLYGDTIAGGGATNLGGFPSSNSITGTYGFFCSIGGGYGNTLQNAGYGSIGGGVYNSIQSSFYATIGGGQNIIGSNSDAATIGGGLNNYIEALSSSATIAGGQNNQCTNFGATVGGGGYDGNSFMGNMAAGAASTVSGGLGNSSMGNYAAITGGYANSANGIGSFVGGGGVDYYYQYPNVAAGNGSAVSGGVGNVVDADDSLVSGGLQNTIPATADVAVIGGGYANTASNTGSVVGGGVANTSSGASSTVPGGIMNVASGDYSFAAGSGARAAHQGAFVWADTQSGAFSSTAVNQFAIRAGGGVQLDGSTSLNFGATAREMINLFTSGSINYGIGVQSSTLYFRTGGDQTGNGFAWYRGGTNNTGQDNSGGGATLMTLNNAGLVVNGMVASTSDRNAKQDFAPVDPREILDKVTALPITKWMFKTDTTARHIGPMAQDFYAAFAVGPDDKHITTVDEGGVALAAIQGLNQKLTDKDAEIQELKQNVAELKKMVQALADRK